MVLRQKRAKRISGRIVKGVFKPSKTFTMALKRSVKNINKDIEIARASKNPLVKKKFLNRAIARSNRFKKKFI